MKLPFLNQPPGSGTWVDGSPHFHIPSDAFHQLMAEAGQGLTSSTVTTTLASPTTARLSLAAQEV